MVRADLIAAIRNALERGENLDSAKKTLVNSGYSSAEIEEAGSYFQQGTLPNIPKINLLNKTPQQVNDFSASASSLGLPDAPRNQQINLPQPYRARTAVQTPQQPMQNRYPIAPAVLPVSIMPSANPVAKPMANMQAQQRLIQGSVPATYPQQRAMPAQPLVPTNLSPPVNYSNDSHTAVTFIVIVLIIILLGIIAALIFYGTEIMTAIFETFGIIQEEAFLALL